MHNSDHVRRGADELSGEVFAAGTAAILLEAAIVVAVIQRHRWTALLATLGGLSLAAGYLIVHFLPERSFLSDSFLDGDVSGVSWVAASLEVAAALTVGVLGWMVLAAQRRRPAPSHDAQPLTAALVHPVAVAMIVGNGAILVASFVQR